MSAFMNNIHLHVAYAIRIKPHKCSEARLAFSPRMTWFYNKIFKGFLFCRVSALMSLLPSTTRDFDMQPT